MRNTPDSSSFMRCELYTGLLPSGVMSPGFLPVYDATGYAVAWIIKPGAPSFENSGMDIGRWAGEYVRRVQVIYAGPTFTVNPREYDLLVPVPFHSASWGIPNSKRGVRQAMVPKGQTLRRFLRSRLTDMSIPLSARMDAATGILKKPVPDEASEPQYPMDNDVWL